MRRWLWTHFTRDGRDERLAARRYQRMLDTGRKRILEMHATGELKKLSPVKVIPATYPRQGDDGDMQLRKT